MIEVIGHRPRTDRTVDALRAEIASGRFVDMAVLPGERELAPMLGVSRTTLRRAIAILVDRGELVHRPGFGTAVVTWPPPETQVASGPQRDRMRSPGEALVRRGDAAGFVEKSNGVFQALFSEARALGLSAGTLVCRSVRHWLDGDGRVIAIERQSMVAGSHGRPLAAGADWLDHLAVGGATVVSAECTVRVGDVGEYADLRDGPDYHTNGVIIEQSGFDAGGSCLIVWRLARRLGGFEVSYAVPPTGT